MEQVNGRHAHIDGTPIFQTQDHVRAQQEVARAVEAAWNCTVYFYPSLCPIDGYIAKHERMRAITEMRARTFGIGEHSTCFLNVVKWAWMLRYAADLDVPPILLVKYTDALCWKDAREIDARRTKLITKRNQWERERDRLCIEIPVSQLHRVGG